MSEAEKSDGKSWKGPISLPNDLANFVKEEQGQYGARSKVVQAALRLYRDVKRGTKKIKESSKQDLQKTAAPVKYPKRKRKSQADQPGARVETDHEARIRKIDQAFTNLCGFTIEEIRGKRPREFGLIRDDSDPAELAEIRAAIREVRPAVVTLVNYRKNGTRYNVRIDVRPTRNGFVAFETEVAE